MKKHKITLTEEKRLRLRQLISAGKAAARKLTHARILLKADASDGSPNWPDQQISPELGGGHRDSRAGTEAIWGAGTGSGVGTPQAGPGVQGRLDGVGEAHLIALACGQPPEGREHWTMQLLAEGMVALGDQWQNTPLHEAANAGVAELLINHGADVNADGWMGATPLHKAAHGGRADVVELLIRCGADVHTRRS